MLVASRCTLFSANNSTIVSMETPVSCWMTYLLYAFCAIVTCMRYKNIHLSMTFHSFVSQARSSRNRRHPPVALPHQTHCPICASLSWQKLITKSRSENDTIKCWCRTVMRRRSSGPNIYCSLRNTLRWNLCFPQLRISMRSRGRPLRKDISGEAPCQLEATRLIFHTCKTIQSRSPTTRLRKESNRSGGEKYSSGVRAIRQGISRRTCLDKKWISSISYRLPSSERCESYRQLPNFKDWQVYWLSKWNWKKLEVQL